MNLPNHIGDQPINQTIERHPQIGAILQKYDIGCVTCGVGICLVKDVVAIHALGDAIEAQIEAEISAYLATTPTTQSEGENK
jgi:anaerobic glycerol-3-phosphate dehydrogenase